MRGKRKRKRKISKSTKKKEKMKFARMTKKTKKTLVMESQVLMMEIMKAMEMTKTSKIRT